MPIKRPIVSEMDLTRARQIVCSLSPLKRLSCDDAEIVARAIAEGIAGGRKNRVWRSRSSTSARSLHKLEIGRRSAAGTRLSAQDEPRSDLA